MKDYLKSPFAWFLLQAIVLAIMVATIDQSLHPLVIQVPFWVLIVYTVIWLIAGTVKNIRGGLFTIREGNHYSLHFPKLWFGKRNHKVRFFLDRSCWYSFNGEDAKDVNKLWGVSFGKHHTNSYRLGWRASGVAIGVFELLYYAYDDGVRVFRVIGSFNANEWVDIEVEVAGGCAVAIFNDERYVYIYDNPVPEFGYYLFPYFGGNRTAPRDMKIYLDID